MTGVTFGTKHTWDDWGAYLNTRPDISAPEVRTKIIDVEGADGSIDLTELFGRVLYKDRNFSVKLLLTDRSTWDETYSTILAYLHGKRMNMITDEAPNYKWNGRFYVEGMQASDYKAIITITGVLNPYKISLVNGSQSL